MTADLAMFTLFGLLGVGAFGVLAGAVVTIIATPTEPPVEVPVRAAGLSLIVISLLVFMLASIIIAEHIA